MTYTHAVAALKEKRVKVATEIEAVTGRPTPPRDRLGPLRDDAEASIRTLRLASSARARCHRRLPTFTATPAASF